MVEQIVPRARLSPVARIAPFAAVLMACASSGSSGVVDDASRNPKPIFQGAETPTMYAEAPRAVTSSIAKPVAAVRAAIRQALTDYSIPITVDNPTTGQIGNLDFYRSRQFMGRPMTEMFSCGGGITGPNAATYRIFMSLIVTAKADATGGTGVGVLVQATARDVVNGTTNDRLVCGGTGKVEALLVERIKALSEK